MSAVADLFRARQSDGSAVARLLVRQQAVGQTQVQERRTQFSEQHSYTHVALKRLWEPLLLDYEASAARQRFLAQAENDAVGQTADAVEARDWRHIVRAELSAEGSDGVLFVTRLLDGRPSRVVLKASKQPGRDLYATLLAQRLGVGVPAMRIVARQDRRDDDVEFYALRHRLRNMDAAVGPSRTQMRKIYSTAQIVAMEFVAGRSLQALAAERPPAQLFDAQQAHGRRHLFDLGLVCALDALLGNYDRLPLLWRNDGNVANLLYDDDGQRLVAIDPLVNLLHPGPALDNYLRDVADMCSQLRQQPDTECPHVARVRACLHDQLGVDIADDGALQLQRGLIEGLHRIAARLSRHARADIAAQLRAAVDNDVLGTRARDVDQLLAHPMLAAVIDCVHSSLCPDRRTDPHTTDSPSADLRQRADSRSDEDNRICDGLQTLRVNVTDTFDVPSGAGGVVVVCAADGDAARLAASAQTGRCLLFGWSAAGAPLGFDADGAALPPCSPSLLYRVQTHGLTVGVTATDVALLSVAELAELLQCEWRVQWLLCLVADDDRTVDADAESVRVRAGLQQRIDRAVSRKLEPLSRQLGVAFLRVDRRGGLASSLCVLPSVTLHGCDLDAPALLVPPLQLTGRLPSSSHWRRSRAVCLQSGLPFTSGGDVVVHRTDFGLEHRGPVVLGDYSTSELPFCKSSNTNRLDSAPPFALVPDRASGSVAVWDVDAMTCVALCSAPDVQLDAVTLVGSCLTCCYARDGAASVQRWFVGKDFNLPPAGEALPVALQPLRVFDWPAGRISAAACSAVDPNIYCFGMHSGGALLYDMRPLTCSSDWRRAPATVQLQIVPDGDQPVLHCQWMADRVAVASAAALHVFDRRRCFLSLGDFQVARLAGEPEPRLGPDDSVHTARLLHVASPSPIVALQWLSDHRLAVVRRDGSVSVFDLAVAVEHTYSPPPPHQLDVIAAVLIDHAHVVYCTAAGLQLCSLAGDAVATRFSLAVEQPTSVATDGHRLFVRTQSGRLLVFRFEEDRQVRALRLLVHLSSP